MLREDILPALGITITAMADHLHITRQQLHRVLAEESSVSPEMAVRLGKLCGNGPHLWIRMQEAFDLWRAQEQLSAEIELIPTLMPAA